MDLLKTVGLRMATAGLLLGVVMAGIAWWRLDDDRQGAILSGLGRLLAWGTLVLASPWAGWPVVGWVARRQSNAAGAVLVIGLTLVEALLLAVLLGSRLTGGAAGWTAFAAAVVVAGLYNLLICDWIADRSEV